MTIDRKGRPTLAENENSQAASHRPHGLERDVLYRKRKKKGKFTVMVPPAPLSTGALVDTHAHLGAIDAPLALARAAFWGLDFLCCITEPDNDAPRVYAQLDAWREQAAELLPRLVESSRAVLAEWTDEHSASMLRLLEQRAAEPMPIPRVRLAIGCHPHTSRRWNADLEALMYRAAADSRTCAIGEIGLDYWYDLSPRETQQRVFRRQVRLAKECGLPVFLHIRDAGDDSESASPSEGAASGTVIADGQAPLGEGNAHADALAILQQEGLPPAGVILHCCSLPPARLQPWIDAGAFIAYGGITTFPKQQEARDGAARVPVDRLLFETDSPYMAPHPLRGNQCAPDFVRWTAGRLAQERGCADDPAAEQAFFAQVHANALGLQDRPPTPWQREHAASCAPLVPVYAEYVEDEDDVSDEELPGAAGNRETDNATSQGSRDGLDDPQSAQVMQRPDVQ